MDIKTPTFEFEGLWSFPLDDQLTIICNQLIATSKSEDVVDKSDDIQAKMIDSLIIVRKKFFSPTTFIFIKLIASCVLLISNEFIYFFF